MHFTQPREGPLHGVGKANKTTRKAERYGKPCKYDVTALSDNWSVQTAMHKLHQMYMSWRRVAVNLHAMHISD